MAKTPTIPPCKEGCTRHHSDCTWEIRFFRFNFNFWSECKGDHCFIKKTLQKNFWPKYGNDFVPNTTQIEKMCALLRDFKGESDEHKD